MTEVTLITKVCDLISLERVSMLNRILVACILVVSSHLFAQQPAEMPPTVTAPYIPVLPAEMPPTVTAPYIPVLPAEMPPTVTAPYIPVLPAEMPPTVTAPYIPVLAPVPDPIGTGIPGMSGMTEEQCIGLRAGMSFTAHAMDICDENKFAISEDILANNAKVFDAIKEYKDAVQRGESFMALMELMTKVTVLQATGSMLEMEKMMNETHKQMLQSQYDSLFQQYLLGGCVN